MKWLMNIFAALAALFSKDDSDPDEAIRADGHETKELPAPEEPEDKPDEEPEPEPSPDEPKEGPERHVLVDRLPPSNSSPHEDTAVMELPDPEIEEPGIKYVGAWAGYSSILNPERDLNFCLEHGINRVDVIVNDHSAKRDPYPFDIRDTKKIERFCRMAIDMGLDLHFMSWVMPHRAYIDKAAEILIPLVENTGCKSLQWDAEEPWTQARNHMGYRAAAEHIADKFGSMQARMGVNGIGYTPKSRFGPLAKVCDYIVPQCYSTHSSGLKPEEAVPRCVRRWKKVFPYDKEYQIGLAAYRQKGIPGHTVKSAMQTALATVQAMEGVDTVIYWSLGQIRRTREVREFIKTIEKVPVKKPDDRIA
jgi:hypothetical protein